MDASITQKETKPWAARFFTIWTAQAFSLLGSQLVSFAVIWWLTKTTGSATVLATASSDEKLARLREFGAAHGVNYRTSGLVEAVTRAVGPDAIDLVVDTVGGKTLQESVQCLRYRGRIDDGYADRLKPNRSVKSHDLRNALDDLLAGKPVREPATVAVGCPIQRDEPRTAADAKVTYYRDVLPVLQANCQECHRPGAAGPFSLLTYKQAVNWAVDIKDVVGFAPNYPMIGDTDLKISKAYGMLPAATSGTSEGRTAADNQTVRNVFIVGPDKKIKLILVYPMTTGRNFDEVLRVIDSLQMTAKHRVATPANWKQGEDVIIAGSVSDEEAKKIWPQGFKAPRPYIRIVPQPRG